MTDLVFSELFKFQSSNPNAQCKKKRRLLPCKNVLTDRLPLNPLELVKEMGMPCRKRRIYWVSDFPCCKRRKMKGRSDTGESMRKYDRSKLLGLRFPQLPNLKIQRTCREINEVLGVPVAVNKAEKIKFINRRTNKVILVDRSCYLKVLVRYNHLHVDETGFSKPGSIHVGYHFFRRRLLVPTEHHQQRKGSNDAEELANKFDPDDICKKSNKSVNLGSRSEALHNDCIDILDSDMMDNSSLFPLKVQDDCSFPMTVERSSLHPTESGQDAYWSRKRPCNFSWNLSSGDYLPAKKLRLLFKFRSPPILVS